MSAGAALDAAAEATRRVAAAWAPGLTGGDRDALVAAFHRAESLAHGALEAALGQVGFRYRADLARQLADEARHVALFDGWRADDTPVVLPAPRSHDEATWFALLLVNEVAGFCQFTMLAALLPDPEAVAAVKAVATDEVEHVVRLSRWLAELRAGDILRTTARRFGKRLESRMHQFLPRPELLGLRQAMAAAIAETLAAIVEAVRRDQSQGRVTRTSST